MADDKAVFAQFHRIEPNVRPSGTGGQLDEALQARIADPLFLLARQRQLAEFHGEDGGSPVGCSLTTAAATVDRFRPGDAGPSVPYPPGVPVEYLAEAGRGPDPEDRELPLRTAARAGLRFLHQLAALPIGVQNSVTDQALAKFPLLDSASPGEPAGDPAGRALGTVLLAHAPHGGKLARGLATGWHPTGLSPAHLTAFNQAATVWKSWFAAEHAPPTDSSWVRDRLEHHFAVEAALGNQRITLTAPEYPGGGAEGYHFDIDAVATAFTTPGASSRTVLPTRATYPGMPAERWWEFEDTTVNLPSIEAGVADLARLLLVEFANVYGNDHWVVPLELEIGRVHGITDLTVVDTFGDPLTLQAAGDEHWSLFRLGVAGSHRPGPALLPLLPRAAGRIEGPPVEEVLFVRDEMANLAWAIERTVHSATGKPRPRADETPDLTPPGPSDVPGALTYQLESSVPYHWIPLVPVPLRPGSAAIRFRRGRMTLPTAQGTVRTQARGRLLEPEAPRVYFRDEEIPRAGVTAGRVPVTVRGHDGLHYRWIGRRSRAGQGEAASGLAFDAVLPAKETTP
ncbi:hypothetical protein [Streptomyces vietnamensis]|uniref:Uncharacterized protein n=1 Tax=Streptomyces vietnamensis TaxID=362257 RepID=A0A0B5ILA7_9ACTN|nr:hypothetical protein [Streptomyces vietnamensis]AJF69174.1 hypothetical protein SVTN_37760 [Streptomyces vietnamensis]